MAYYQYIRDIDEPAVRQRTAEGLLRLRNALAAQVPRKTIGDNLLIATWNIREFDSNSYGRRSQEAIYYITEIIDHFDLVAIQEINENLEAVYRVRQILGAHWNIIYSDVTAGNSGNQERLGFLYDSRKLSFTDLAGEVVIPPLKEQAEDGTHIYRPQEQLARTPFLIGLRTSWFKFMISTVHIIYGSSVNDSPERVREIGYLSDFLATRVANRYAHAKNLILLGDFNIFRKTNKTFAEITRNFYIPPELQDLPSNIAQNKFYDQIAFKGEVPIDEINAGIFNFYEHVYRPEDELHYADQMPATYHNKTEAEDKNRYYRVYWRTYQMSDHFPMWVELKIDFTNQYLQQFIDD